MDKNAEQSACNGDQHEVDPVDTLDEDAAAKEKLTAGDPNKVKFTSVSLDGYDGKNGEAKVDIQVSQTTVGMGKDELMKYANEPFWVRLRMFLFILFWVAWFVMLIGAIIIIIMAPRCPPPPKVDWHQYDAFYQVDVATFQDSDGDGTGDFKGIISKLDYFKQHFIGALLLSPFYKSDDEGGIVDYKEIDERFGTLEDFDDLVTKLKEQDIKLVIDFDPNHSSDKHPWFESSVKAVKPLSEYYIWADSVSGKGDRSKPPNNWASVKGGSAWEWNVERGQFYLHTFGKNKPDLNLKNEYVQEEMKDILKFWLEKGVDGVKVTAASHLIEADVTKDEAIATTNSLEKVEYKDLNHMYTLNQPENMNLFEEWKAILLNFTTSPESPKILVAEVSGPVNASTPYFGNKTNRVVDLMYNDEFTKVTDSLTGTELKHHLNVHYLPEFAWPSLMIGNKNVPRLASRVGEDLLDAIHMAAVLSGSTPFVYYGDELGIPDYVPEDGGASTSLTVMLWNNETASGFSNGSSKYPVHTDYLSLNVKTQENAKSSHLKVFSKLLSLKKQPAITLGFLKYPIVTEEIFSLVRVRKGSPGYLFVVNLGGNSTTVDFTGKCKYLPETGRVEIRGSTLTSGVLSEGDHPKIPLNNVPLGPKQSVVFSFVPIFEG